MDIAADLAAVTARIAEITGTPQASPIAVAQTGPDGLPIIGNTGGSFSNMVAQAMNGPFQANPDNEAMRQAPAMMAPAQIDSLVQTNAAAFNVDPNLVKAIIANESGFNAHATSGVGAQGLMQLMPSTAAGLGVTNAYDPAQNVYGGTKYIKGLLDRFNGDMRLAVAAYNAGPGAVQKYNGVPPYAETQNYVQNVLASYEKYKSQGGH